jgi:aromatic ring hydroxylase
MICVTETRPSSKNIWGKAGVSAAVRLRPQHDFCSRPRISGYQAVLAIHAEGSIEAEKLTIHREYDFRQSLELAKYIAGLSD